MLEANGVKREELLGISVVKNQFNNEVFVPIPEELQWLTEKGVSDFYSMNDNKEYDDTFREQKLTEMFAARGIEVEFIN